MKTDNECHQKQKQKIKKEKRKKLVLSGCGFHRDRLVAVTRFDTNRWHIKGKSREANKRNKTERTEKEGKSMHPSHG